MTRVPYVTDEAVGRAAERIVQHLPPGQVDYMTAEEAARDALTAAAPYMAGALLEMFAAVFDDAATQTKLHPLIHNNIRNMILKYGKAVGPDGGSQST